MIDFAYPDANRSAILSSTLRKKAKRKVSTKRKGKGKKKDCGCDK
jgi:hypothetical protein